MIAAATCDACGRPLERSFGEFHYEVAATAMLHCGHCNYSREDPASQRWRFCSVTCLGKLVICKACDGKGSTMRAVSDLHQVLTSCPACGGTGLRLWEKECA